MSLHECFFFCSINFSSLIEAMSGLLFNVRDKQRFGSLTEIWVWIVVGRWTMNNHTKKKTKSMTAAKAIVIQYLHYPYPAYCTLHYCTFVWCLRIKFSVGDRGDKVMENLKVNYKPTQTPLWWHLSCEKCKTMTLFSGEKRENHNVRFTYCMILYIRMQ